MKLNRTDAFWDRKTRNDLNENWDIIEGNTRKLEDDFKNVVNNITDDVVEQLVDNAKLNWKEPVPSQNNLPGNAQVGDTRMTRDTGKVYRFNGSAWVEIQQIDAGPVNEVDTRLTAQLTHIEKDSFKSSLINHKSRKKMVVWTDDDGKAGIYTVIAPLLREYGIKATFAILTGKGHGFPIDGLPSHDPIYVSYEQMEEMYEEGIAEFVSHSHTHAYFDSISDEQIHYELKTSQEIIKKLGWNYKDFIYPGGRHDDNIMSITSQYYESALKVGMVNAGIPFNQYALPRITLSSTGFNPETINDAIDDALDKLGFAILMTHVDLDTGLNPVDMRHVIEHVLNDTDAEFVTMRELIREHGNVLQQGDNVITASGGFYGSDIGSYKSKDNTPINAPIDNFATGATTRVKVKQDDSQDYDLPWGINGKPYGVLETYRDGIAQDDYSYQIFYDRLNYRTLMRGWLRSSNEWGDWRELGDFLEQTYKYTPNAPMTEFPKGKVVRLKVNVDDSESYNIPKFGVYVPYGIIENHRDLTNDDYSFQVFYNVRNNVTMKRSWSKNTNKWADWVYLGGTYLDLRRPTTLNQPIENYAKGTTSKIRVLSNDASAFGITDKPSYGFIEVHRDFNTDTFSCRVFTDIQNKRRLIAAWSTSTNTWGNWSEM